LFWRDSGRDFCLFWAALLAAAAAYTKNEGLLFFVVAVGWLLFIPGNRVRSLFIFGGTFLILYVPWYYWVRIVCGFHSDATAGLALSSEAIVRAWGRLPNALEMIVKLYTDIRQWNLVLWGLALGWIVLLWKPKYIADVLVPAVLLCGYLLIVAFHQAEIYWQVGTSWNRLTVQIIPLLMVIVVPGVWKKVFVK